MKTSDSLQLGSTMLIVYFVLCIYTSYMNPSLQVEAFHSDSSVRSNWTFRCPCVCEYDEFKRKRILCENAPFNAIPTNEMDKSAETLVISGSAAKPIKLTLGQVFTEFKYLQEIAITHASIVAIGPSTFKPVLKLTKLDLSNNKLRFLHLDELDGPSNLQQLDLSHNQLESPVSMAFSKLTNLIHLSLAHNNITQLAPRLFSSMKQLEILDLSFNNLGKLERTDLQDIPALKQLLLVGCNLQFIHSLVYDRLPRLEVLDLRSNQITSLAPKEFKSLPALRVLNIDENQLTSLLNFTFQGLQLESLSLARNEITSVEQCVFCNSTVQRLDISHNSLRELSSYTFKPLRESLSTLNIGYNHNFANPSRSVYQMLKSLNKVKILSLESVQLDDSLPSDAFYSLNSSLSSLNLAGNNIVNVSTKWFNHLSSLEQVGLSGNQIILLPSKLFDRFNSIKNLKQVFLHDNPWSCYRCHIVPLVDWIRSNARAYTSVCSDEQDQSCVKCNSPGELKGRNLHAVDETELAWCSDPNISQRQSASQPRIGLVLAILIIISICAIIVAIIIVYRRKQSASYYTREDEPSEHNIFTIERLMNTDSFNNIVSRKSFDNNSLMQHNNVPAGGPFSPAQDTLSPASLSPPMSPLSPVNRALNRASPSRSLSQSLSSIPAPPPLPPPDLPPVSSSPPPTLTKQPLAPTPHQSTQTKPKEPM